jgi:hypothetical protein
VSSAKFSGNGSKNEAKFSWNGSKNEADLPGQLIELTGKFTASFSGPRSFLFNFLVNITVDVWSSDIWSRIGRNVSR